MPNENDIQELKASNKQLNDELIQLRNSIAKIEVDKLNQQIASLTDTIAKMEGKDKEKEDKFKKFESKSQELEAEVKSLQDQNAGLVQAKEAAETALSAMKLENVKAMRVSTLVDAGVSKEVAEKKVAIYASLSDEQFTSVAEDMKTAYTAGKKDDAKKDDGKTDAGKKDDDDKDDGADANLDSAEGTQDVALATQADSGVEAAVATRKTLSDFFAKKFNVSVKSE